MARIFTMKEIRVVAPDEPGLLARVTAPIADARVNIGAFCTFVRDGNAEFYFVTADNSKVMQFLENAGFSATERDVIVIETGNEAGTLYFAARHLAQIGVDVEYSYATTGNLGTSWLVFATRTPDKALNSMP